MPRSLHSAISEEQKEEESLLLQEQDEEFADDDDSSETNENEDSSTAERERREKEEVQELIRRETKSVLTWRETVTGILMIIAFVSSVATFVFLGREEHTTFVTSFNEAALMISNRYTTEAEEMMKDAQVLSDLVTTNAGSNSNSSTTAWPFVTVPHWELYARHIRSTGASDLVMWAPVVTDEQRREWEDYSTATSPNPRITPYVHGPGNDVLDLLDDGLPPPIPPSEGPYAPVWQTALGDPATSTSVVNLDLFAYEPVERIFVHRSTNESVLASDQPSITSVFYDYSNVARNNESTTNPQQLTTRPHSVIVAPILDSLLEKPSAKDQTSSSKGLVALSFDWYSLFQGVLPNRTQGVQVVVRNSCQPDQPFTYLLQGPNATYLGRGEQFIDLYYANLEYSVVSPHFATAPTGGCDYLLSLYPTQELRRGQNSDEKRIYTLVVLCLFLLIGLAFWFYDRSVQVRNEKMLHTATKSNLVVSSLFPSTIKKRLLADNEAGGGGDPSKPWTDATKVCASSKPLADFFPEATVLFADIVGFTAWSSVREPSQVFVLLESIYHAYDQIARRRRIFKIETIGDCYVATAGLPEPRVDHAPAMARFAYECLNKMHQLTARLEETLGPDTGDLSMRIGIHSGPVTAGVLRGERSRFQLFGDTVNTAARLESTGKRGRIHISQETANLLTKMGKGNWVVPREEKVSAKGKGELSTFWLAHRVTELSSHSGTSTHSEDQSVSPMDGSLPGRQGLSPKLIRLVNWNVEILSAVLKQIIARRRATKFSLTRPNAGFKEALIDKALRGGKMVINEVQEIITLPKYTASSNDRNQVDVDETVMRQLRDFVMAIAESYKDNPFHNFEHASHVTMSVSKLLSRIVAPKIPVNTTSSQETTEKLLHDHTYGITSDPLTQFACIFSALIHDAEHDGVPNAQLVKEETELAARYNNQSVAEQNSVDVAWGLLMKPDFKELRAAIYCDEAEMVHFRKLVVNCVMATDICDKDLKDLRNKRWEQAFQSSKDKPESHPEDVERKEEEDMEVDVNRKATIVIEHLLQASDVSHTMQHWHVFRKWNENLFTEMYCAYREGRSASDPSKFWYKGEIGFFDFYVIPLAKKLAECGVFGVSSDEYLNYAESNRREWESRGKEVVKELAAKAKENYDRKYESKGGSSKRASMDFSSKVTVKSSLPPSKPTYVSVRSSFFKVPSDAETTITAGLDDVFCGDDVSV